jgi:hypothetical protein
MTKLSTIATFAGLLALLSFAQAGDKPVKNAEPTKTMVPVVSVRIHPAALPTPALKYHLLPTFLERTPGNAMPLYGKAAAFILESNHWDKTDWRQDQVGKWLQTPLDAIPRDKARQALGGFYGAMGQVELATKRDQCDWDMSLRQGHVFEILLPEVSEVRWFSYLFALRARLQMAEGKYGEALLSLQVGYSMARQIAEQPFLVSGLVGMSIVARMNYQLLALCQLPNAPNLYWSITALPHPMIDLRKSVEAEYDGLYLQFPQLQTVRRAQYTPEQWNQELRDVVGKLDQLPTVTGTTPAPPTPEPAVVASHLLAAAPAAKKDLIALGYSQKEVDAMPLAKIALLHTVETFDQLRDDVFKWSHLPYWQAREGLDQFAHDLPSLKRRELIPIASVVLPCVGAFVSAGATTERQLAALRCIEALRLYAAVHNGKLPATLDEIKEVPIPLNPVTGKPFGYHLEGQTAVLDADGGSVAEQYRINVAK